MIEKTNQIINEKCRLLSHDERVVMRNIAKVAKTNSRIFDEHDLKKKKPCHKINVPKILTNLSKNGLVKKEPKKGKWRATNEGMMVEHYLEDLDRKVRYPFRIIHSKHT